MSVTKFRRKGIAPSARVVLKKPMNGLYSSVFRIHVAVTVCGANNTSPRFLDGPPSRAKSMLEFCRLTLYPGCSGRKSRTGTDVTTMTGVGGCNAKVTMALETLALHVPVLAPMLPATARRPVTSEKLDPFPAPELKSTILVIAVRPEFVSDPLNVAELLLFAKQKTTKQLSIVVVMVGQVAEVEAGP